MATSATGSIGRFFPDIFGGGSAMSGAGASATTSAATGAGSMALGPWMAASAGIQGLSGIIGGALGQQSEREAREEANKWGVRNIGLDRYQQELDKANQMAALREGYSFMRSPVYQQDKMQNFRQGMLLAGKYGIDPYSSALGARFGG